MGNGTHFGRVAILLCLPPDNVHRARQRLPTIERCHREHNKHTENPQKGVRLQKYAPCVPPSSTQFRIQTALNK